MPTLCGGFLQTSVLHIPKMALCFSIFERGSATASIQLPHEFGAQWKQALQGLIFAGSWMRWNLTTKSPMSSSKATSLNTYPSWNTWGLFNRTACSTGPKPPGRGVDMFRNTWCASVRTELSNAPAAWTYDSRETPPHAETNVLDSSANQSCIPPSVCESVREVLSQRGQGIVFFCDCLRVAVFNNDRVVSGRLKVSGVCLRTELSDFCNFMDELVF